MGASLPQLESCCCGCSLRTGALIVLWLTLIGGLLYVLSPVVPANYANPSVMGSTANADTNPHQPASGTPSAVHTAPPAVVVTSGLIFTVVSGFGLYGVYKEIGVYLVPFLIWSLIQVIIVDVGALLAAVTVGKVVSIIIGFLIFFYLWLVVFSHYRVLKGTAKPPA